MLVGLVSSGTVQTQQEGFSVPRLEEGYIRSDRHTYSVNQFGHIWLESHIYHLQHSCGKVIFSQASVILSTLGCLPQCMLRYTPLLGRHPRPLPGGHPPTRQTPPARHTPLPLPGTHPLPGRHPPAKQIPPLWMVCILLECILVTKDLWILTLSAKHGAKWCQLRTGAIGINGAW